MTAATLHPDYSARHHYQQPEVHEVYDERRFTSVWGKGVDRLEKRALRRAMRDVPADALVLELACGTGRMTEATVGMGFRVLGLDISFGMLRNAYRKVGQNERLVGLVRSQAETLPVSAESVDAVMTYRFLHHLGAADRQRVYREMHRVTRRFAVLQFSSTRSILFWLRQWRDRWKGKEPRIGLPHRRFVRELESAGFRERKTTFALPGLAETYVTLFERSEPVTSAGRSRVTTPTL
ncbi:MAG: methyltransferase domain-containing protein [Thermoplasmata archaeon]